MTESSSLDPVVGGAIVVQPTEPVPLMAPEAKTVSDGETSDTTIDPLEIESADIVVEHEPVQHPLGVLPLAMIVFYNVSGGPFGIEESIRSAGFFFSILGFLIMPFVWSAPEALMTAELGSAYPEASGGVAWVEEAFGSLAGWQAGYLGWVAGATDSEFFAVGMFRRICIYGL